MNKKILIITYYWFPYSGTGVYRISKFAKYLKRMGWEPVILTAERSSGDRTGGEIDPEYRDIPVYRTPIIEPAHLVQSSSRGGGKHALNPTVFYAEDQDWKQKLAVWLRLNVLIPDAKLTWRFTAYSKGKEIIRREQPDLILSTSPPPTAHMLAKRLAKWSGLPWLADFRDPWTNIYYYDDVQMNAAARRLNRRFERSVLRAADRITLVNRGFFPEDDLGDKSTVIPNGYDREDLPQERISKAGGPSAENAGDTDDSPFTVCYTGSLKMNQYPQCLIDALKELSRQRPEVAEGIRFTFYGHIDPRIQEALSRPDIRCRMVFAGLVPHAEAIRGITESDLHLLIIGRNPGSKVVLSTKVFEYMMTGKPVLCIGPTDGSAAQLVRETGIGRCVSHNDADGVRRFLETALDAVQKGETAANPVASEIEKYDFRTLTGELDRIIRSMASPGEPPRHEESDHTSNQS